MPFNEGLLKIMFTSSPKPVLAERASTARMECMQIASSLNKVAEVFIFSKKEGTTATWSGVLGFSLGLSKVATLIIPNLLNPWKTHVMCACPKRGSAF